MVMKREFVIKSKNLYNLQLTNTVRGWDVKNVIKMITIAKFVKTAGDFY